MNKEKYNFVKKIGYMMICLFSILFVVFVVVKLFLKDNKDIKSFNISKGWELQLDNKKENNIDISKYSLSGHKKVTSCEVSYKINNDYKVIFPAVFLKTDNHIEKVLIDNKEIDIEGLGKDVQNKSNKATNYYYTINLPENYVGKTLKIKFDIIQTEKIVNSIILMSENDFVIYSIRKGQFTFILSTVMCIIGVFIILLGLMLPDRTNRIKKLFWTGVTFLFSSIALVSISGVLELILNSNRLIKNLKIMGLFLCIPSVLMMAYNTFNDKKYKKIVYIGNISLYVVYAIIRVLQNFSIISYEKIMLFTEILIMITATLLLIYNMSSLKKANAIEKIYSIGTAICYVESIVAVCCCFINANNWDKYGVYYIAIEIFTFFIVTIIYYAYVTDGYIESVSEKKVLSLLAYTDPLTGIMNRSKYEDVVKDLTEKHNSHVIIIMFDLNNLKKINDKIGHEQGDLYIKSFAKSLEKTFENCGFIGRIGGDEFSVIIENKNIEVFKYIKKMDKLFKQIMKQYQSNNEFEYSFSYGYASSKEDNMKINDLINLADERMYSNKKQQKLATKQ